MSKRFGRNQRRKLRAELAHVLEREAKLSTSYWREQELMAKLSRDNDELRETINLTERVLGKHFVTLPPKTVDISYAERLEYLELSLPDKPSTVIYPEDRSGLLMEKIRAVTAAIMRGETWVDDLVGKMHIKFYSPTGEVRYCFAKDAFRYVPPERVATYITHNMAEHLKKDSNFKSFVGIGN